jgi:isoprenylcysteine carboxyl methyltransferase (ICMT) family protein YpbQ
LSHPNYTIATAEIVVLPLALHLHLLALIFTVLNALVLAIRIRAEHVLSIACATGVFHDFSRLGLKIIAEAR